MSLDDKNQKPIVAPSKDAHGVPQKNPAKSSSLDRSSRLTPPERIPDVTKRLLSPALHMQLGLQLGKPLSMELDDRSRIHLSPLTLGVVRRPPPASCTPTADEATASSDSSSPHSPADRALSAKMKNLIDSGYLFGADQLSPQLTAEEYRLMALLLGAGRRGISRDQLVKLYHAEQRWVSEQGLRKLQNSLAKLRKKISYVGIEIVYRPDWLHKEGSTKLISEILPVASVSSLGKAPPTPPPTKRKHPSPGGFTIRAKYQKMIHRITKSKSD